MTYTPVAGQIWPQGQPRQGRKNSFFKLFQAGQYELQGYEQPFSSDAVSEDPYFANVSLLLHMDGSNGSTTFTDDSSNALSVTAYGNAQISTVQSKFGGASGYFDGNGDYLLASSASLAFGTGDFTVEGWIYVIDGSSYRAIASFTPGSDTNTIYVFNSSLIWYDDGNRAASATMALNTWHHFAVTRASGVLNVFLNGTQSLASYNSTRDINAGSVRIGTRGATNSEWFSGYIDDLRITKGVARYTANFTPPDASFPGQSAIDISQITYSQSSVYPNTTAVSNALMTDGSFINTGSATNSGVGQFIQMDLGDVYGVGQIIVGTATSSIPGGWSRSYTENRTIQHSLDGTTWTNTLNTGTLGSDGIYTFNVNIEARYIRIIDTNNSWIAISEFYALTPVLPEPEPPSGDPYFANVSLLLHMDGSDNSTTITDSSVSTHIITVYGKAKLTTSDKQFGTAALTLDGSGDYITTPAGSGFQLGTGDFTVECWCKPTVIGDNDGLFTFGGTGSGLFLALYLGNWVVGTAGGNGTSMGSATNDLNTWRHIAVTRSGTSLRLFIDGVQKGSTLTNSTNLTDNQLKIGYYYNSNYPFNGLIDEFRVTKGVARYTSNFTPPTGGFVDPVASLQPLFWYDFADESSVTLSNSNIESIQNKGSQVYTLSSRKPLGPTYENGINGLKCVNFGNPGHTEYLRNTSTANYTIGEVYIVLNCNNTFGASFPNYNGLIGSTLNEGWRVYGAGSSLVVNGFDQIFPNNSSISGAGLPAVNSPIVLRLKKSDNTGLSSSGGFILGNETQNSALGRGWGGFIGEVIAFSAPLSSQDRQEVLSYLYGKWAITP